MDDAFTPRAAPPARVPLTGAGQPRVAAGGPSGPVGVGGWLLVLCVFLVLVCPLVCLGLIVVQFQQAAPTINTSLTRQLALLLMLGATALSAALGLHASWALWRHRPGAVATAKRMFVLGLALGVLAMVIELALSSQRLWGSQMLDTLLWRLAPDLLVFAAGYGYLNRSLRVQLTYGSTGANAPGAGAPDHAGGRGG